MKALLALVTVVGILLALYAVICETRLTAAHVLVISDLTQSDSGPKMKLSDANREQLARRFGYAERDWSHLEMFGLAISAASFAWFIFEIARKRNT